MCRFCVLCQGDHKKGHQFLHCEANSETATPLASVNVASALSALTRNDAGGEPTREKLSKGPAPRRRPSPRAVPGPLAAYLAVRNSPAVSVRGQLLKPSSTMAVGHWQLLLLHPGEAVAGKPVCFPQQHLVQRRQGPEAPAGNDRA